MFGSIFFAIFQVNTRLKALDEIYKIYTLLQLWNPIEKPWQALRASVLRTRKTAPEKKLSDRGSYASQNEGAHGHAALPAEVGTTLIQKIKPVTRCTAPAFAPLSIQNFSQISSNFSLWKTKFIILFSKCKFHWFLIFSKKLSKIHEFNFGENSPEFQHFLRKRPKSVRFSNFLRFRNGNWRIFQSMIFLKFEKS